MRADRGAGMANGDGGMMMRGDSGRLFEEALDWAEALLL